MKDLYKKYPPSEPCSCEVCVSYCRRPGWWTPEEAALVISKGFSARMMLEIAPSRDFAVLAPAFKGNEGNYAFQVFSDRGCTFLGESSRCELFGTGLQPLECRFCHHTRRGEGKKCHNAIEKAWNTNEAKRLIVKWGNITGLWQRQGLLIVEKDSK